MNPLDALRLETLMLLMLQKSGDHQLDMVNIPLFKGFHRCQVVSTQLRKMFKLDHFQLVEAFLKQKIKHFENTQAP